MFTARFMPQSNRILSRLRKLVLNVLYLWFHFLPDCKECFSSVYIFSVSHVRNIKKDHWFPINESIEDVLLKSSQVVLDVLALPNSEGIMTVGENDGLKLMLKVKKVTSVDVGDGDLVLPPDCRRRPTAHQTPACLDEVVVSENKEINKRCCTPSLSHCCGNKVLHGGIVGDCQHKTSLLNRQSTY